MSDQALDFIMQARGQRGEGQAGLQMAMRQQMQRVAQDRAQGIPPVVPEPVAPGVPPLEHNTAAALRLPSRQRLVITYGPTPGLLVVGLETGDDWELQGAWPVPAEALEALMPLLLAIFGTQIKDFTGQSRGYTRAELRSLRPQAADPPAHRRASRRHAPREAADGSGDGAPGAADPALRDGAAPAGPAGNEPRPPLLAGTAPSDGAANGAATD